MEYIDVLSVVRVNGVLGGSVVTPFDVDSMSAFNRNWKNDTAAAARQWAPYPGDPLKFYIYPKAPAVQVLDVTCLRVPATLALGATITDVPASAKPALVDYVVYRAESKDDENTLNERATFHIKSFVSKIKGGGA
jgi:hypothetical protein